MTEWSEAKAAAWAWYEPLTGTQIAAMGVPELSGPAMTDAEYQDYARWRAGLDAIAIENNHYTVYSPNAEDPTVMDPHYPPFPPPEAIVES